MALIKIKDFDPNYREVFGGHDLKGIDVYSDVNNEKIGSVNDLLVDEQGYFRYFVIDLGFWGFGKKVLLPMGRSHLTDDGQRVYALGFTKQQVEHLPEFSEDLRIDNSYEEQVRGVYRTSNQPVSEAAIPPQPAYPTAPVAQPPTAPHLTSTPQQAYPPVPPQPPVAPPGYPPAQANVPYNYQQDPALYNMNSQHHSVLQRYQDRLLTKRRRTPV